MAKLWRDKRQLGGRFFFSPNIAFNQDIKYFCRTIAYDIAANHAQLAIDIQSTLSTSPEATMDFPTQLVRLVIQPLRKLRKGDDLDPRVVRDSHARKPGQVYVPVFLVIDALDNCEYGARQKLLNALLRELPNEPYIKVFLTSRPYPDIADALGNRSLVKCEQLLDINNPSSKDIAHYVHTRLTIKLVSRIDNESFIIQLDYSYGRPRFAERLNEPKPENIYWTTFCIFKLQIRWTLST